MILGAGLYQIPVIEKAQRMGFRAIVVSSAGNYPGFKVADKAYEIDVRDKERILEVAKKEQISGIVTEQTDIAVPTVAYVAERMNLPGIDYQCALRFTNKYLMRQACEAIGVPVPRHVKASTLQEAVERSAGLNFPIILKPVDNQGSRGVVKLRSAQEIGRYFDAALAYSSDGSVILEEFVHGKEVVIQGFANNSEFKNLVLGDRAYFDIPNLFIPKQTLFPSALDPELQEEVLDLNTRLITHLAPKFGITHSEYLVNPESGDIFLIETAIRGGGVFISSDLVPLACGIDPTTLLIRIAAGETIEMPTAVTPYAASGYLCFTLPDGIITRITGADALPLIPGVHKVFLQHLEPGRRTTEMRDKTQRQGPILITAKDRNALEETIQRVKETLKIEVETKNGIRDIIW